MPITLSSLSIYPIKSTQPIQLSESEVLFSGLKNDRRFMLVDQAGAFVTGRSHPKLTLVGVTQTKYGWSVSSDFNKPALELVEQDFSNEYLNVDIWENTVSAQRTHSSADQWFSELLGEEVTLVRFGSESTRVTSRRPEHPVKFADGYPFLLTTQSSLDELNKSAAHSIEMQRFRTNIMVSDSAPFAEDTWKLIKIGEVVFENVKPCARCIFTTLDPKTAQRSPKGEPLKSLAKFRRLTKDEIVFGVNLIALNEGVIRVGDEVHILEYQTPPHYEDRR